MRWRPATVAWLAATLLGACFAGTTRGPVELTEAILVDATTLSFGVPSCNGEPEVSRLEETSTEVRVEVVSTVHRNGDACADSIRVALDAPLAEREVIDLGGRSRMTVSGR